MFFIGYLSYTYTYRKTFSRNLPPPFKSARCLPWRISVLLGSQGVFVAMKFLTHFYQLSVTETWKWNSKWPSLREQKIPSKCQTWDVSSERNYLFPSHSEYPCSIYRMYMYIMPCTCSDSFRLFHRSFSLPSPCGAATVDFALCFGGQVS